MHISLEGKHALVGGCTKGLGRAIALQLAQSGATVTLMARDKDALKILHHELDTSFAQKHQVLVSDFNNFIEHQNIITQYFKNNEVDILVNNTQGPPAGSIDKMVSADYQQSFELLFQINCTTSLAALPGMKKNRFGRIINVSSQVVKEGQDNLILSNTIRTALVVWSKSLANTVAPYNITVNNILTGDFETDRLLQLIEKQATDNGITLAEGLKRRIEYIPMKRLGKPEEYAYLVTFLASDQAGYITGISIPIDGGKIKSH